MERSSDGGEDQGAWGRRRRVLSPHTRAPLSASLSSPARVRVQLYFSRAEGGRPLVLAYKSRTSILDGAKVSWWERGEVGGGRQATCGLPVCCVVSPETSFAAVTWASNPIGRQGSREGIWLRTARHDSQGVRTLLAASTYCLLASRRSTSDSKKNLPPAGAVVCVAVRTPARPELQQSIAPPAR